MDLRLLRQLKSSGHWTGRGIKIANASDSVRLKQLLINEGICNEDFTKDRARYRIDMLNPVNPEGWFYIGPHTQAYHDHINEFKEFYPHLDYYVDNLRKRRALQDQLLHQSSNQSYQVVDNDSNNKGAYDFRHLEENGIDDTDSVYDHDNDTKMDDFELETTYNARKYLKWLRAVNNSHVECDGDEVLRQSVFEEYSILPVDNVYSPFPVQLNLSPERIKQHKRNMNWARERSTAREKSRRHGWGAVKQEFQDQHKIYLLESTRPFHDYWKQQNSELSDLCDSTVAIGANLIGVQQAIINSRWFTPQILDMKKK
eukprot:215680_1